MLYKLQARGVNYIKSAQVSQNIILSVPLK